MPMSAPVILALVGLVSAVPITAAGLRHARRKVRRDLARRIAGGDVAAGVPANWLAPSNRLMGSGCLALTSTGTLRWEPDPASIRRGRATGREWDAAALSTKILRERRGFTGERYEVLRIMDNDGSSATFVVFGEVGPWHLRMGLHP